MPEIIKLLGSTKRNEDRENVHHLEIAEVVLVHCNIVNNDYQQDSWILYTFVHNKLLGQLLDISLTNFTFLNTFDSEFWYIEVLFSDINSKCLKQWCSVVVVNTTAPFIQQSLNLGSVQVEILLVVCFRFAMVKISGNGSGWK